MKNQTDPDNPHRGRTAAHREYERGVRELTERFIKDNGIDRANPMTREQANKLVDAVESSKDPRVRGFPKSIDDYVGQSRQRRARFRGFRGGGRGQE